MLTIVNNLGKKDTGFLCGLFKDAEQVNSGALTM